MMYANELLPNWIVEILKDANNPVRDIETLLKVSEFDQKARIRQLLEKSDIWTYTQVSIKLEKIEMWNERIKILNNIHHGNN